MFDKKCLDLAESFLSDYDVTDPMAAAWVAQRIQTGIDDDLQDLLQQGRVKARGAAPAEAPPVLANTKQTELPSATGSLNLELGDMIK